MAASIIAGLLALVIVLPTAVTLIDGATNADGTWWPSAGGRRALGLTLAYAAGIALLATLLAWAPARVMARWPAAATALACVPALLPPYLAYAGWTLWRAPGTWLGDAVFRLSADPAWAWLPMAVGRACAVLGLACWAWPLAAAVLSRSMRWRLGSLDEQLAMDGASPVRALAARLRVLRGSMLAAFGLVLVVMLGSAVPLHVAQVETFALRIWLELDQTGPAGSAGIWLSGWPLWLPAMAAGVLLARFASRALSLNDEPPPCAVRAGPWAFFAAGLVWALSALVPLGLFAAELFDGGIANGVQIMQRFIASADQELRGALLLAMVMVVLGTALGAASGALASDARFSPALRWLLGLVLAVSAAGAMAPGVLVGSSLSQLGTAVAGWGWTGFSDGPWLTLAAMIARWSVVPIGAGVLLAASEPGALAALRRLDAGSSLNGFARGWLVPHTWPLLAIGGLFAVLGLHEIEAAVQVASPGWPSLPRKLLNMLHFARDDDLSAAVVLIETPTLVLVVLLTLVIGWRSRR